MCTAAKAVPRPSDKRRMEDLLALLLVVALGVAYLAFVWAVSEEREIRFWAVLALVGSVVLGLDATLNSFCGIAENRSELFNERCEGSVPYIPLYAIPLLLAMPLLRRFLSGPAVLMVAAVLVLVAIAIPQQLLSV
jgi:hypothetical protein